MAQEPCELDFELLDDVLPGIRDATSPIVSYLMGCRPRGIGPLVEYAFQSTSGTKYLPSLRDAAPSKTTDELATILSFSWASQGNKSTSLLSLPCEFSRVPQSKSDISDPFWVAYVQRVKHAASAAGFTSDNARRLAGSFFELADNLWQHSQAPETAIVGYCREQGLFEFVIADAGIGVVASLNQKADFATLVDAGTALEIALSLAETPYGKRTGRGEGYRNMFANLVDLWGSIRVRSGDHGVKMDGTSPSIRTRTTFQSVIFKGFIITVSCKP
jgi:anti-sigma regulatory factor (Ser/Thr protein kinase)